MSTPTKLEVSRNNTKFSNTQVVDILFWNWFLVDLTFIVLNFEEADEGDVRAPLEIQVAGGTRVLGAHFWHALNDIDEEMDDVE